MLSAVERGMSLHCGVTVSPGWEVCLALTFLGHADGHVMLATAWSDNGIPAKAALWMRSACPVRLLSECKQ